MTVDPVHGTKVECECPEVILIDERAFGLGFRCVKCGLSADHRLEEFMERLHGRKVVLTDEQRASLKYRIAKIRRQNARQGTTITKESSCE
jgi:hypothetical protein